MIIVSSLSPPTGADAAAAEGIAIAGDWFYLISSNGTLYRSHEGGDVDAFLDNEQSRYRAQLEAYAAILNAMVGESQPREIRLGLYFPMLKGWREWGWRVPVLG